jgi:predicted regulator of amino acid metabolism with ACT domain
MSQYSLKDNLLKVITDKLVLKIITLLTLTYLVLIPLGRVKNKFEATDVAIFIVILLFNSGLVERLGKLEFKDGSLSIGINELKKEQETQREKIAANTEIIQRLTALESLMTDNDQKKKQLYVNLIHKYELEQLKRLASDQPELVYELSKTLKQELRRLRALGFIESLPNKHISSMKSQGNLRDYVKITERGKEYLQLVEEVRLDLEHKQVTIMSNSK